MQRRVLHRFVMMAKRQMPARVGDQTDSAEDKAAQEGSGIFHFLLVACRFMMEDINYLPLTSLTSGHDGRGFLKLLMVDFATKSMLSFDKSQV